MSFQLPYQLTYPLPCFTKEASRRCPFSHRAHPLKRCARLMALCSALALPFTVPSTAHACQTECTPRTALVTAYSTEIEPFIKALKDRYEYRLQGTRFTVGKLNGEPVVVFMTGVSVTNAAMNTQRALDMFNVKQIVFSGIAGSVDASQHIGDVAVPARWANYGESLYARETNEGYQPSATVRKSGIAPYGMIYPRLTDVLSARSRSKEERLWFPANDGLLTFAKTIGSVTLSSCASTTQCTQDAPVINIGGSGVSGSIFMDNADYRDYLHDTFDAQVADMESGSAAQVAYANQVPFIAFRSVSDLAGGGEDENTKHIYAAMAAKNAAAVVCAFLKQLSVSSLSASRR